VAVAAVYGHVAGFACSSKIVLTISSSDPGNIVLFGLRMVPDAATAASGGSSLFAQYRPFAILKPKNRKKGYEAERNKHK
jgi:hypothetical protein